MRSAFFFAIAMAISLTAAQAAPLMEQSFRSTKTYGDPFNEIELDVIITTPSGQELRVPAFWAGEQRWTVRYFSLEPGTHRFHTVCSDAANADLHDVTGTFEIAAYEGSNPLYRHGAIRVVESRRHFEHADGTPFFWLGDTWWMGLCHRLRWPEEFATLAADRKRKGFTVIQIVAGLYPDMQPFDPRGANEAGFPWEKDYARINPAYFDAADERLRYLVDEGLVPCIVGAWGYYIDWMGIEKVKKHWRYLIARYGAMPVIWCAAGEANLPWYLDKGFPYDDREQVTKWTQVMRYIRKTDPFRRPLTIHPTGLGRLSARHATDDAALLDFDMLQTPHGQRDAVEPTVRTIRQSYRDEPVMPVINGEAAYEMLNDNLPTEWTRRMMWLCLTSGAAGHTYGANGIWQCNRAGQPHGPSPHHPPGNGYGAIPWDEAMKLPGSAQAGCAKKLLERFEWWKFEPNEDWAQWADGEHVEWGDWIWHAADGNAAHDAPAQRRRFRFKFDGREGMHLAVAKFQVTADDRFVLFVNGRRVGESAQGGESWRRPQTFNLAPHLKSGENVIEIEAENVASNVPNNPAGLICGGRILLTALDPVIDLKSDARWESSEDGVTWARVRTVAPYGAGPWGRFVDGDKLPTTAAGIAGEVRVIYVPSCDAIRVRGVGRDVQWKFEQLDPVTGESNELAAPAFAADGSCVIAPPAHGHDWILVVVRKDTAPATRTGRSGD